MSPAINDLILALFDHSAQGVPALTSYLESLFRCESISLCQDKSHASANDHRFNQPPDFIQKQNSNYQDCLSYVSDKPGELRLSMCTSENLCLVIGFTSPILLEDCLHSTEFRSMLPHIQQATLIAYKISQQHGDMNAIHYVLEHHPLSLFCPLPPDPRILLTQNKQASPNYAAFQEVTRQTSAAANHEKEPTLNKDTLIEMFKLTPSEAELTTSLFKGLSLQEAAISRSVSKQTTRKQLQAILKKTHCASQEALMLRLFNTSITQLNTSST